MWQTMIRLVMGGRNPTMERVSPRNFHVFIPRSQMNRTLHLPPPPRVPVKDTPTMDEDGSTRGFVHGRGTLYGYPGEGVWLKSAPRGYPGNVASPTVPYHLHEDEVARRWFALPFGTRLPLSDGGSCQLVF